MESSEKHDLFAHEYASLFDFIYRYVRYRLPNRDDAEDVVSETFTKAYARLADFAPERGSLRQWLTGVAKNEILMHWRRTKPLVSLETIEEVADPSLGRHLLERLDRRMFTEKMFSKLSDETKALLALRYVEDLSYEELSEITGKEVPALRQFFSRLHRSLRVTFEEEHVNFLSL